MAETLGYLHNAAFWEMCANISSSMPVVYVQNAYSLVNVTGSLTVKNLKFSGINAMATTTNTIYDILKFPIQFCTINKEPTGADGTISLTKET